MDGARRRRRRGAPHPARRHRAPPSLQPRRADHRVHRRLRRQHRGLPGARVGGRAAAPHLAPGSRRGRGLDARRPRAVPLRPLRPAPELGALRRRRRRRRPRAPAAGLGQPPVRRSRQRVVGVQPARERDPHLEALSRRHRPADLGGSPRQGRLRPGHRLRRNRRLPHVARRPRLVPVGQGRNCQPVVDGPRRLRSHPPHRPRRLGRALARHGPRRPHRVHAPGRHPRPRHHVGGRHGPRHPVPQRPAARAAALPQPPRHLHLGVGGPPGRPDPLQHARRALQRARRRRRHPADHALQRRP